MGDSDSEGERRGRERAGRVGWERGGWRGEPGKSAGHLCRSTRERVLGERVGAASEGGEGRRGERLAWHQRFGEDSAERRGREDLEPPPIRGLGRQRGRRASERKERERERERERATQLTGAPNGVVFK